MIFRYDPSSITYFTSLSFLSIKPTATTKLSLKVEWELEELYANMYVQK
jgi:hypothetical protein